MKKNAIWLIVGLMGLALLAITLLQAYWINGTVKLNEEEFKSEVQFALNRVAIALTENEDEVIATKPRLTNGFALPNANKGLLKSDSILLAKGLDAPLLDNDAALNNRNNIPNLFKIPQKLDNRIDRRFLRENLASELKNIGINIGYEYGVYSYKDKEIVIQNGNYLVTDIDTEQVTIMSDNTTYLTQSEYEVDLFTNDMQSPGKLVVYFPKKSSVVWSGNVWRTLLASIISSAIVLFCFMYTVNVIFTQKKLSEMKTDFINNMTHEFKTPIATISLAADSITSPMILSNEDKVKRFADIIKQENRRMNKQVEKVLQMASLDKKDYKLNITRINLHEVIQQAVTNSRLQVEQKEGTVDTNLQATDPAIEGDATHISNIINNLLDNANKYTPEKPKIAVLTRNVANGVEVTVKDNGIGMTKEAKKHIFDKFYRVHTGNLHDVKGFGLGLSYVKALVTAHQGQINVKSELGKGSSFIITLPKRFKHTV